MIAMIKKILGIKLLPPKNLDDFTLSKSSTVWWSHEYCNCCKSYVTTNEILGTICNSCGSNVVIYFVGAKREIWNGTKWQYQIKYEDDTYEIKNK